MIEVNGITVNSTNGNSHQKTSVRAYRDGVKIAEVFPTSMYGGLYYLRQHPGSKYTADFRSQLENNDVETWVIDAILSN